MRIKDGFILRTVGKERVVVAVGEASIGFNGIIHLNETGEFLWKQLEKENTPKGMLEALLAEYDIGEEQAKKDIGTFIEKLRREELIEE